jgi:hypothetical protein
MRISIPKPCHENWNEMTPEQQGAFCKVCNKVVVDFSAMSDEEVIAYLEQKKEEKTCGRFRTAQLSPYELKIDLHTVTRKPGMRLLFAAALFVTFSSFFSCTNAKGDTIVFNRFVADAADTAKVTLMADTTTAADSFFNDFIEKSSIATTAVVGEVDMLVVNDTNMAPLVDTAVVAPPEIIMGAVAYPEPEYTKGKVVCTDTTPVEPPRKKKKTKNKRGHDGNVMGLLLY